MLECNGKTVKILMRLDGQNARQHITQSVGCSFRATLHTDQEEERNRKGKHNYVILQCRDPQHSAMKSIRWKKTRGKLPAEFGLPHELRSRVFRSPTMKPKVPARAEATSSATLAALMYAARPHNA